MCREKAFVTSIDVRRINSERVIGSVETWISKIDLGKSKTIFPPKNIIQI